MPRSYNPKLRETVKNSMIDDTSVPIVICDENFSVCFKNRLARSESMPFTDGASVIPYLSDYAKAKIASWAPEAFSDKLSIDQQKHSVIISVNETGGERYFSLIFVNRLAFCKYPDAWYMTTAYRSIADSLNMLLESPKTSVSHTNNSIRQLIRLCSYCGSAGMFEPRIGGSYNNAFYIREVLGILKSAATPYLASIGAVLDTSVISGAEMITTQHKEFQMLAVTLVIAFTALSSDGIIKITCSKAEDAQKAADITVAANADPAFCRNIKSYDDLLAMPHPLSIELAALKDASNAANIPLRFKKNGSSIELTFRIRAFCDNRVIFHADTASTRFRESVAQMFGELFRLCFNEKTEM